MDNIKEITLEELVKQIVKAQSVIEETEASVKVLKDEIRDRLTAQKITGTKVDNYYVSKVTSVLFSGVPISEARELGATKKEEKLNLTVLKKLYEKGVKLSGVKSIQYVKIVQSKD